MTPYKIGDVCEWEAPSTYEIDDGHEIGCRLLEAEYRDRLEWGDRSRILLSDTDTHGTANREPSARPARSASTVPPLALARGRGSGISVSTTADCVHT